MKNLQHYLILILIFSFQLVKSQSVNITKNSIEVNARPYLKKSKCGMTNDGCSILNLNDKEIIYIHTLKNPNDYRFTYSKIVFLGTGKFIESKEGLKSLIKLFYESNLVNESGELNKEAVDLIVEKIGHTITENIR